MKMCTHCNNKAITELDGDHLCKTHADEWVRGEGNAMHEAEESHRDCEGEGWYRTNDGVLITCQGNKCH